MSVLIHPNAPGSDFSLMPFICLDIFLNITGLDEFLCMKKMFSWVFVPWLNILISEICSWFKVGSDCIAGLVKRKMFEYIDWLQETLMNSTSLSALQESMVLMKRYLVVCRKKIIAMNSMKTLRTSWRGELIAYWGYIIL